MKKTILSILLAIILCFSLGMVLILAENNMVLAENTIAEIKYDCNETQIRSNDTNINGVTNGVPFNCLVYETWESFEDGAMRTQAIGDGNAVVLDFDAVDSSIYDTVQIALFVGNWTDNVVTTYVFSSIQKILTKNVAVYSFTSKTQSNDEMVVTIPTTLLADENGMVNNITFMRGIDSSDKGHYWFDYVRFYNSRDINYNKVKVTGIHTGASSSQQLYFFFSDDTGFGNNPDGWEIVPLSLAEQVTFNGTSLKESKLTIMTGGSNYLYYISAPVNGFSDGDKIIIPINTKCDDGFKGFKVMEQCILLFNGTTWSYENVSLPKIEVTGINISNSNENGLYIMVNKDVGLSNPDILSGWTDEILQLNRQIYYNGILNKLSIQMGGNDNLFYIGGPFVDNDKIIIPANASYINEDMTGGFKFQDETILTYDGESWNFTIKEDIIVYKEYIMDNDILCDCTYSSITQAGSLDVLYGSRYAEASNMGPDRNWGGNYLDSYSSKFLTEEEAPEGANGAVYRMSTDTTYTGLCYQTTIFKFTQDIPFNLSDDLEIKLYIADGITGGGELWFTNLLSKNVYDVAKKFPIDNLEKDQWITLSLRAKDLKDDNNIIPAVGITIYYPSLATVVNPQAIYFDTFKFVSVERVVKENYSVKDISEVIPLTQPKTYQGTCEEISSSDYDKIPSIIFARTDASGVEAVKMNLTISELSDFNLYFVLNGSDLYFKRGGIYYWLSESDCSIGTVNSNPIRNDYISNISAGTAFTLEIGAIPYYVEMIKSGYYAYMKINDIIINEVFVDNSETTFGTYFGAYMHDTTNSTSFTFAPIESAVKSPVELTLSIQLNKTEMNIGEEFKLSMKKKCVMFDETEYNIQIIEGSDFAEIDGDGYLLAKKAGTVKLNYRIENSFGVFNSNTVTININSPDGENLNKGCFGNFTASNMITIFVFLSILFFIKTKKQF